ncbi:uncharacterized protein LOC118185437 [Stegodyphus dumicola]|uniref:uncharacterized protein LOC118185437 n=1 Tax=Stegodyphus dumicola TaxID=202533 RepID=UPI0015AE5583|nr:uncharacterized protein LOC118185437 [Stegodyphus dumicola]
MACCIGARLVHSVYAALDLPDLKIIAWSDSMVALWWIKNRGDWSVFVANRVKEINSLIPSQCWRHLPGDLNPADMLSGGWWERLVRVVKELLRRTLGNAVLTTEELYTVLCDCESIINSRPLTYVSENPDDLIPLSPAMFLIENRSLGVPDVDFCDSKGLRKRARHRQKLLNDLRHRFRKEYLGLLVKNKKDPSSELRLGEIVLIGDDIKKRMHWPLAKVIRLIPGKDGKVRTVELKTQAGTLLRPIQRVFPLEVQLTDTPTDPIHDNSFTNPISSISSDEHSDSNDSSNDSSNILQGAKVSRFGRVIKVPQKLDLFDQVLYVFEPT